MEQNKKDKADNTTIVDCADRLDAMRIDDAADAAAVPMVDTRTTKAKRQTTHIAERRAQRKAQRQAMVEAKRAARILKAAQKQQQNARKAAQKQQKLPDKALTIIQSNPSLRKLVQSDDAQTLLMEWYVDPSKPSIVDFLTSKD